MRILLKGTIATGFREINADNDLRTLQELVNGNIEVVTLTNDCVLICNEEGVINNMRFNCNYMGMDLFGPILLAGVDGEDFTDCPWSVTMANEGITEEGR